MAVTEEAIINKLAVYEREIVGVNNSYGYGENPGVINNPPIAIHYSPGFDSELKGVNNHWQNMIEVQTALFVVPRQSKAARLSLLEAEAIPYGQRWRAKFQTAAVINDFLSLGLTSAFLTKGKYGVGNGAGNSVLTWRGTDFFGWVFTFVFIERI